MRGVFPFAAEEQCELLISKWHVYLLKNGRISMVRGASASRPRV